MNSYWDRTRRLLIVLAGAAPLALFGCGDDDGGGSPVQQVTVEGITVTAVDGATVSVGETADYAISGVSVLLGSDTEPTEFEDLSEEALETAVTEGTLNTEQKDLILEAVAAVQWSSAEPEVASVTGEGTTGTATGEAIGETEVVASLSLQLADPAAWADLEAAAPEGEEVVDVPVTGSAAITVEASAVASIQAEIEDATLSVGESTEITVTATHADGSTEVLEPGDVAFSSSDEDVASVAAGLVSAEGEGEATLTVTYEGLSDTVSVVVSGATLEAISLDADGADALAAGTTLQITATGSYSDGTEQDITDEVTWSSSDADVVDVSSAGVARGVAAGEAVISASLDGIEAELDVQVTEGEVESISVEIEDAELAVGNSTVLSATATLSDGSIVELEPGDCSSDDEDVAVVDEDGIVTAVGAGSATLTCTFDGVTGSVDITVTDALPLSLSVEGPNGAGTVQFNVGQSAALTAIVTYSDGSTDDVTAEATWTSDSEDVALVDDAGEALAVGVGGAVVTASFEDLSATISLSVADALAVALTVSAEDDVVPAGSFVQLSASVEYEDGTVLDVTDEVLWTVTDGDASVDDEGVLDTTDALGVQVVQAEYEGLNGQVEVEVTGAIPTSLEISPAVLASLPRGLSQQFVATAFLSDGTDLEVEATWTSEDDDALSVDDDGLATAAADAPAGVVTLTASYTAGGETVTDTVDVTISTATPVSLDIAPLTGDVPRGFTFPFTATLTLSDDSTFDATQQVAWSSSDTAIATIGTGTGIATGVAAGTAAISAIHGASGLDATEPAELNVTAVTLTRITLAPAKTTVARGATQQFTATGEFSDGTVLNVTRDVSWTVVQPTCGPTGNQCLTVQGGTYVAIDNVTTPGLATGLQASTDITYTNNVDATDPPVADGRNWYATVRATSQTGAVSNTAQLAVTTDSIKTVQVQVLDDGDAAAYDASPAAGVSLTTLPIGVTARLRAFCTFEDNTTGDCTQLITFTGTSSTAAVLDNAADTLTGAAFGGITISASPPATALANVTINTVNVNVVSCGYTTLTVNPPAAAQLVPLGTTFQALATLGGSATVACNGVQVSAGSNITWTSGAPGALTASASGLYTALTRPTPAVPDTGLSVVVTGRYVVDGVDLTGTQTVSLRPACIIELQVAPAVSEFVPLLPAQTAPQIRIGQQLEVTAVFSDPEIDPLDITGHADLRYAIGLVANPPQITAAGIYTPTAAGDFTVDVSVLNNLATTTIVVPDLGNVRVCPEAVGSADFEVTSTRVETLAITGPSTVAIGQTNVPYTVTATFQDEPLPPYDVTAFAEWASNNTGVLGVSANLAAPALRGRATGVAAGSTILSAVLDGITTTRQVTVGGRVLTDVIVGVAPTFNDVGQCSDWLTAPAGSPSRSTLVAVPPAAPIGLAFPLVAIAVFSNGDQELVSTGVTFASSGAAATVASSWVTAAAAGSATVKATYDGVTSSDAQDLNLTVAAAGTYTLAPPLVLLPVAQVIGTNTDTLGVGASRDYDAVATFNPGGLECDVSRATTWTIAQPGAPGGATVSADGVLTTAAGQANQSLTLNASYTGQTAARNIGVVPACVEELRVSEVLQARPSGSDVPVNVPLRVEIDGRLSGQTEFTNIDTVEVAAVTAGVHTIAVDEVALVGDIVGGNGTLEVDRDRLCDSLTIVAVENNEYEYEGIASAASPLSALSISGDTTLPLGGTRGYSLLATYTGLAGTWDVTLATLPVARPVWGEVLGGTQLSVPAAAVFDADDAKPVTTSLTSTAGSSTKLTAAYANQSAELDINIGSATLTSVQAVLFRTLPGAVANNSCDFAADAETSNFTATNADVNANIPIGGYHTYAKVIGTYSDGSTADVTAQTTFASNSLLHTIVPATGVITTGPATAGNDAATVTLTATVGALNDTITLNVVDTSVAVLDLLGPLNQLGTSGAPLGVAVGTNTKVFAFAEFANGVEYCVTSRVTFTKTAPEISLAGNTVTGASPTATAVGVVVSGALTDGSLLTADINVVVTNATISAIDIFPDVATLQVDPGETAQLRAFADFTDGTLNVEITSDLTRIRWGIEGGDGLAIVANVQSQAAGPGTVSINNNGVLTVSANAAAGDYEFSVYSISGGLLDELDVITISVQ